ncbi:MAG: bifunctional phosphopantothenoylcysteine decarboxylase/phosphopantothenate--cysteine ligase CoaBC [Proteobacteria bacterium]|nr:bifunctional phosphopantothenoylcysteine decarboxylase/phosphopantothenate--cysteine ligase CoaBC [Pseudomonadota bacterium]
MEARRILVAGSGGIAAYKLPEVVRALVQAGHDVRCALTPEATRFVSPLVLQALTQSPVRHALFDPSEESQIDHISLADWAELVVVAPATANVLAKLAHGLADDLVTAVLLATRARILVAPAMNVNMWEHPATRENVERLRGRGVAFAGPEAGELACGWVGQGRMAEPLDIAAAAELELGAESLAGARVVVTAAGTREAIDDVRSLTNRSSGRMGFEIAGEAARRGAEVVLVAGPTPLSTPAGVERLDVESALEMRDAVLREAETAQIIVKAAAVADFRPAAAVHGKIKKENLAPDTGMTLELVRNPDILAELCASKGDRVVVGFAAESEELIPAAQRKLARKGCDLIVANDVSRADAGFDVDTNAVSFVWPGGEVEELPLLSKRDVASRLLDRIEALRAKRRAGSGEGRV